MADGFDREPRNGEETLRIVRFDEIHEPTGPTGFLSPDLRESGAGGPGGGPLDRARALAALEELHGRPVVVESLEVVRMSFERPEFVLETRRCDRAVGESFESWCQRSQQQAEELVRAHSDPDEETVRYLLVTAEEGFGAVA
jgi:hypothetical protein